MGPPRARLVSSDRDPAAHPPQPGHPPRRRGRERPGGGRLGHQRCRWFHRSRHAGPGRGVLLWAHRHAQPPPWRGFPRCPPTTIPLRKTRPPPSPNYALSGTGCRGPESLADRVLLDPGFGFGTTFTEDLALWNALPRLPAALAWPADHFCIGISRKRFLAVRSGTPGLAPDQRDPLRPRPTPRPWNGATGCSGPTASSEASAEGIG